MDQEIDRNGPHELAGDMRQLIALDLPGGMDFVQTLQAVWDGGDAAFVLDQRLPRPAKGRLLRSMAPAFIVSPEGRDRMRSSRSVDGGDALVVATSGSTGEPKGVVLTHAAIEASARATSARIGVDPADRWLACLPLSHVGGLSVVTRALATGTPVTVLPGFDPNAVAASDATLVSLVPTALARIDPSRFRVIVLGGSRPPPDRPANTVTTYGMTETGSGVVYDGRPLDGVDVRIDTDGEIHLRGPMLLRSYRDDHDPKDSDGWFATGDVGSWLDDGRLHVEGRRGEMIITGGENVWPEAVERVLATAPGVDDVAVVGVADREWGQVVTALIVVAGGADVHLEGLRDHVKAELPAFCAPRRLVVVTDVPRTALGKVRRGELDALVH